MKPKPALPLYLPPQTALPSLVQVSLNSSPQYRLGSLTRFVRNGSNTTGRRKEKSSCTSRLCSTMQGKSTEEK
ncbi:hypothetical protein CDAR_263171 [Caerostris darwini]|uniref:Uncharacterized protein n=1 Tax=Caerostris darwini TaxID=1538125 RepID=A0AAV4RV64_9ARAC|nr:hypothetical protein CDAR_263171 [Caerostris darwini]